MGLKLVKFSATVLHLGFKVKKRVYVATKSFMGLYRLFFSLTFSCWRQRDAIAEDSNVSIDRGQQTP